jgi:hypothetical protein
MKIRRAGESDRGVICGVHAAACRPEQGPEFAAPVVGPLNDETVPCADVLSDPRHRVE